MNDTYLFELILLFVLLLLSAFFSGSETAITSIGRLKLEEVKTRKRAGHRSLVWLKENPNMMLATVLIGNNFVNISASAVATSLSISILGGLGIGNIGAALGYSIGVMTFVVLVFGEIIPKTVAISNPELFSLISAPVIRVLSIVFFPIVKALIVISTPFAQLFGGKMPKRGPFLTVDEIKMLLSIGQKDGVIEEEEKEMISSIFEFGKSVVKEVMTPRPDVLCSDVATPIEKVVGLIIESGHSRIPVYEGSPDNIIGVVYAKDILKAGSSAHGSPTIRGMIRPALFIPELKRLDDLLHEMQAARTHIAIVMDEYGGMAGLVTMEDLVEEIVGEIYDEFESKVKSVEKISDNTTILDARLNVADVNRLIGAAFPEKEYDTLSGFIFGQLGKLPAVGDQIRFGDILLSVERVHKRRITRVKVVKLPSDQGEAEAVGG